VGSPPSPPARRLAALALLFLAAAPLTTATAAGLLDRNQAVRVGNPAPPLSGEDIQGKKVEPGLFRGRPVLLDFGSIFCGNCQETIREFVRLQSSYRGTDLALVFVTDGSTPVETLRNYFKGQGASFTVIRDKDMKLFTDYGVSLIPFQVAIDRRGVIRKLHQGYTPQLERDLDLPALAGKSPPPQ
jgi:peroxiredoxin